MFVGKYLSKQSIFLGFYKIGRFAIGDGDGKGEGEHFKSCGYITGVFRGGIAHVITNGECFLACEFHKGRNHVDALFAVAVGHLVIVFKGVDSLPCALLVLDITEALLIYADFTKVMKKGYDSDALHRIGKPEVILDMGGGEIADKAVEYIDGMLTKSALAGEVETR